MKVWFNPSCSKCRTAATALDEAGADYTLRRYLEDPPTREELDEVLVALDLEPWDITRMNEQLAQDLRLADKPHDRAEWLTLLAAHPSLLQRPILVTNDGKAFVGRSPEAVAEAIDHDR